MTVVGEPLALYTVEKRCYLCGTEWTGTSFVPQPPDKPRLPGMCAACVGKNETRLQELTRGGPIETGETLPELTRPRRSEEIEG